MSFLAAHAGVLFVAADVGTFAVIIVTLRHLERRQQHVEHELAAALAKLDLLANYGQQDVDFAPRGGEVARRYKAMTQPATLVPAEAQ